MVNTHIKQDSFLIWKTVSSIWITELFFTTLIISSNVGSYFFANSVLVDNTVFDQMDIEQVQKLQREQDQSCKMASTYYKFISKPILSLGIGLQIGLKYLDFYRLHNKSRMN